MWINLVSGEVDSKELPLGANAVLVVDYEKFIGIRKASNPLKKLSK